MEPASWLLIISIIFGGWQYSEAKDSKKTVEELNRENAELSASLSESVKIGANNAVEAVKINTDLSQCVEELSEVIRQQADFERINQDNAVSAESVADDLKHTDWGSTIIPSDVLF